MENPSRSRRCNIKAHRLCVCMRDGLGGSGPGFLRCVVARCGAVRALQVAANALLCLQAFAWASMNGRGLASIGAAPPLRAWPGWRREGGSAPCKVQ